MPFKIVLSRYSELIPIKYGLCIVAICDLDIIDFAVIVSDYTPFAKIDAFGVCDDCTLSDQL